ncbi:hypothetical protein MLD38_026499 [Melastoma candidum]|uniref:Uncharacterized protein n=1 Tax=Melastoma candidum TaxID=119954 RepID=A0ACB9P3U8_9MYRT|nr:hypothetical protein MLD38_026499 [Melastoma candidum]
MCLECSGKHRGLGVHISFVRSVTMDSWSDIQIRKMEVGGGNDSLNSFFSRYGIPKETDIVSKYNSTPLPSTGTASRPSQKAIPGTILPSSRNPWAGLAAAGGNLQREEWRRRRGRLG